MRPLMLAISVALLLPACMRSRNTLNDPLDEAKLAQLRAGETTAREVVELLGAPMEVVQLGWNSAYRYDALNTKQTGLFLIVINFANVDAREDRLWVFFDREGLLTHFGSTLSTGDTEWAMPWEDIHEQPEEPR